MATQSMRNSATALGAYYRSTARRKGGDVAIFATARKLAQEFGGRSGGLAAEDAKSYGSDECPLASRGVRYRRSHWDGDHASYCRGERDPKRLARLRDRHCRKSEGEIAEPLTGHWREDHVFRLQQSLKMYDSIQERMGEYEQEILKMLAALAGERGGAEAPPLKNPNKAKAIRRRGEEPMRQAFFTK